MKLVNIFEMIVTVLLFYLSEEPGSLKKKKKKFHDYRSLYLIMDSAEGEKTCGGHQSTRTGTEPRTTMPRTEASVHRVSTPTTTLYNTPESDLLTSCTHI